MAIAEFTAADRSVRSPIARILSAVVRWAGARRAARAKQEVLHDLLFAPEHRLRDIGISREQLIDAIDDRRRQIL
jgi:uncharacterized protein YjiS (DUF1127 family)